MNNISNTQLITLDNVTLAAGAVHRDIVGSGKSELRKIWKRLPPGAEAIIKFVVVADLEPEKLKSNTQLYSAATVHIANSLDKKLNVAATITNYINGSYVDEYRPEEALFIENAVSSVSNSRDVVRSNTEEKIAPERVTVSRYPLINKENERSLYEMDAETRCPDAFFIMQAVNKIFKKGVPLPSDVRFQSCTFTVAVKISPSHLIQYLSVQSGIRGMKEKRDVKSDWCSTSVIQSGSDVMFTCLTQEAHGEARPSEVPETARQVSGASQRGTISTTSQTRSLKSSTEIKETTSKF